MTKITSASIARNIPEFAREEYPLFVKLMEEYYRYLDTTYAGNVERVRDIDTAPDEFIEYFKKQYAISISSFWNIDFKKFLFFAKSFYSSRGTESSIRFLFRAMFGEEIEVDYPGKNVLRVSDGHWRQEFHIELKTLYGTFPIDGQRIEFSNDLGDFTILPSRVEIIPGTDRCFVFFELPYKIHVEDNQKYTQRNSDGLVIYVGRGIPSSSKITIESPGKYWQIGSVIRIPGSIKDTFARVSKTTKEGAILGIEVLEFGYDHVDNQSIVVSPFPNRPIGSVVDIDSEIISTNPLAFHYTIKITDDTDGAIEAIVGSSTIQDYFLDDFFQTGFFGRIVISKSTIDGADFSWINSLWATDSADQDYFLNDFFLGGFFKRTSFNSNRQTVDGVENSEFDSSITIEQWLESRATLVFSKGNIVRDRGYYTSTESLISDNEVRLHDSFYYQAFSYVIETERELREYKDSIALTHPAGMKFFSLMNREVTIDITPIVDRVFGTDMINLYEVQEAIESVFKHVMKPFVDSIDEPSVSHYDLNLTKNISHDVLSSSMINNIEFTKNLKEDQTPEDDYSIDFVKKLTDSYGDSTDTIDKIKNFNIHKPFSDISSVTDIINKASKNSFTENVSLTAENSFNTFVESFLSDDYFSENYFLTVTYLEIQ